VEVSSTHSTLRQ